jgi:hypothetical protein
MTYEEFKQVIKDIHDSKKDSLYELEDGMYWTPEGYKDYLIACEAMDKAMAKYLSKEEEDEED